MRSVTSALDRPWVLDIDAIYTRHLRVYDTHMSSADLIRQLKKVGWRLVRVNGSHHVFTHPQRTGIVVVPHPKKDLGTGLVKAIRQQAGI
jgi:predicted RNA binding protein YcfA (HicA-like mRNA interferase family)